MLVALLNSKKFYAKILLFGEYAVLYGFDGLAIPSSNYFGHWSYGEQTDDELEKLIAYCKKHTKDFSFLDLERFCEEWEKGLFFESNIPYAAGLGSSGALCAAIYYKFNREKNTNLPLIKLKNRLAVLESFFHSKSSGTDPLVSFTNQELLLKNDSIQELIHKPIRNSEVLSNVYLLDSGVSRISSEWISKFRLRYKDPVFKKECDQENFLLQQSIILSLLDKNSGRFFENLYRISKFQYENMPDFIPNKLHKVWHQGLSSKQYLLKICGAGGGGYFLLFNKKAPLDRIDLDWQLMEI